MSKKTEKKVVSSPDPSDLAKEDCFVTLVTVVHNDFSHDDQYVFSDYSVAVHYIQGWLSMEFYNVREIKIERKQLI